MDYIETKSILSKLKYPDTYFGITYNMNLYRGCQHACVYCDTRSACYQIHDISQVRVKKNALDLLPKELASKRHNKATIGTGSMNDPYMPVERELKMARSALKIIQQEQFPVHIITKSDLVTRDIDILQEIAKEYAAVSLTITSADDTLAQKLEPNAAKTSDRFKAIEQLANNGIYTGITLMPILPYINDNTENIRTIIQKAKDSGAAYIIPMFGVTLRKGSREYFYKVLDQEFVGIKEQYQSRFGEQYECFSPNYRQLKNLFNELTDQFSIATKMKFYQQTKFQQPSLF